MQMNLHLGKHCPIIGDEQLMQVTTAFPFYDAESDV